VQRSDPAGDRFVSANGLLPASGEIAPRKWLTGWIFFLDRGHAPSRLVYPDGQRTLTIRFGS